MIIHNETLNVDYDLIDESTFKELEAFVKTLTITTSRKGGKEGIEYLNLAVGLDTESTSFFKVIDVIVEEKNKLRKKKKSKKKLEKEKLDGIMMPYVYIWMVTIRQNEKEFTIVGRTLYELYVLFTYLTNLFQLNEKRWLPIYIHNYSFEHSFFYLYFIYFWDKLFFTKPNSALYGKLNNLWIEFRCSYLLTGKGLKDLNVEGIEKLDGDDFNYHLIRHYKTEMTDKEMAYCINDSRKLAAYLDSMLKSWTMADIPYTKTGFVRKALIKHIRKDGYKSTTAKDYKNWLLNYLIRFPDEIDRLKACYNGGHTAVNPHKAGKPLKGLIFCYDFASSYPSVFRHKFPTKYLGKYATMNQETYEYFITQGNAMSAIITFKNIRPRVINGMEIDWDSPIHISQLTKGKPQNNITENNGKVYKADLISVDAMELSYLTFKKFYEWDEVTFEEVHVYSKDYLPKCLITFILELYRRKTFYKENPDFTILEYTLAKEDANSVYGAGYTAIDKQLTSQDEQGVFMNEEEQIKYNCKKLAEQFPQYANEDFINKQIELMYMKKYADYNEQLQSMKRAIPYQVGGYVAELARYHLFEGIYAAGDLYIYSDTDSIYVEHPEKLEKFIQDYNEKVKREWEEILSIYKLPLDLWKPKTVKGKEKPLGIWALDKTINSTQGKGYCFKALRAKCYMYVDIEFNKKTNKDEEVFNITIAGLGKEKGKNYMLKKFGNVDAIMENFDDGMKIPDDETGKSTHYIIYKYQKEFVTDYNGVTVEQESFGGTYLENCEFKIDVHDIYEKFYNKMFGRDD